MPSDKSTYLKNRYRRLIEAGVCYNCGKSPVIIGKSRCNICSSKSRTAANKQYKDRRLRGDCIKCCQPSDKSLCGICSANDTTRNERTRTSLQRAKLEAFAAYGGKCSCCDEVTIEFLSIDHINNDGAEHRRTIGSSIYFWLRKNHYPNGFQVLCMNCQFGKKLRGVCPHRRK